MKKTYKTMSLETQDQNNTALILLSVGFTLGGLFGCMLATSVSGDGSLAISTYIHGFVAALRDGSLHMPGTISAAWSVLRWPLFTILLSFSVFGVIGIPILFFIRGFLYSFCISSFVQVLGTTGLLLAFLLVGLESLLSIPVLFIFGIQGIIHAAGSKGQRSKGKRPRPFTESPAVAVRNAVCTCVLLFCTVWEILFVPMLLSGAKPLFPA